MDNLKKHFEWHNWKITRASIVGAILEAYGFIQIMIWLTSIILGAIEEIKRYGDSMETVMSRYGADQINILAVLVIYLVGSFMVHSNYNVSENSKTSSSDSVFSNISSTSNANESILWICSCGTENTSTVRHCTNCGKSKPTKSSVTNATGGANEWKCPSCGKVNQNYVGSCGCGQAKPR